MPESMDIVRFVDNQDRQPLLTGKQNPAIADWLRRVNGYINKLLLPRIAEAAFAEFATPKHVITSAKRNRPASVTLPNCVSMPRVSSKYQR